MSGKLEPGRLLAVDEHVTTCAECKAALEGIPARSATAAGLSNLLLDVAVCPDYEELSAFVDKTLEAGRARELTAHVNACELCASDIARIEELRSHAAMRQTVRIRPGATKVPAQGVGLWRRALSAVAVIGAVAVVAVSFGYFGKVETPKTKPNTQIANNSGAQPINGIKPNAVVPPQSSPVSKPVPTTGQTPNVSKPVVAAVKPVLVDGSCQVIGGKGKYSVARVDGKSIRTALEARIAASIEEKIRTGSIKPLRAVRVAMNTMALRSGDDYTAPATAPTPVSPTGKIVLSDRPVLSWSKVDMARAYRVVVTDAAGRQMLDEITATNSAAPGRPLQRGQVYLWRVGVRFGADDEWAMSKAAAFKVLSSEDLAQIQSVKTAMPGSHMALGATYESLGLRDEAEAEYRALREANPHSQLARRLATW